MKRLLILLLIAALSAGVGWAAYQAANPETPLARYVPAGPLLYLEAKDFRLLLADWNSSPEKSAWVESSNYEVFSRSRLLLRLKAAGDQFAAAAGLPADMNFLSQVAGTRSALALYDIGRLEFLYITRLPQAKALETTLWRARSNFQPRSAGGVNFFLRSDPESQKQVCFAVAGDYLLLATREDLMAGALELIAGSKDRTIEAEPWYSEPVRAREAAGDLRMLLNLDKIVPSSYFRTYWVHENIAEMKQYSAAISDLFRSGQQYREERVLLARSEPAAPPPAALQAAADLVRLIPENAAIYESKASPSSATCFELLETKLLAPHPGRRQPSSETAPQVQLTSGETGSSADLETRIDQAPSEHMDSPESRSALEELLGNSRILASLEVQSTERDRAGVFVRIHTAIVLMAAAEWDESKVRAAVSDFLAQNLTAGGLGLNWRPRSGYQELDGLWPLTIAVRGNYLLVTDAPGLLESMLGSFSRSREARPASFIASFSHGQERDNFAHFSAVVDRNEPSQGNPAAREREPQFFSENLGSLSHALARISSEKMVVRFDGSKKLETVTYQWTD
jgi:hypothetical protein